jgi:hypothetical protein
MHADISRDTFDPRRNILRLVQEQGAVLLDADANEQIAILLNRLRNLATDALGPCWGPASNMPDGSAAAGFQIKFLSGTQNDLSISKGRYYVNGLLCDNNSDTTFLKQPNYPGAVFPGTDFKKPFVVYLEVWEREVTETELRSDQAIDPAFQALSPSPRGQLVWQVKVASNQSNSPDQLKGMLYANNKKLPVDPQTAVDNLTTTLLGMTSQSNNLAAQISTSTGTEYTGPQNQLYRVQIHRGGPALQATGTGGATTAKPAVAGGTAPENATFVWSRDNGSVAFPLQPLAATVTSWQPDSNGLFTVALGNANGRDARTSLKIHDRVEYIDKLISLTPNLYTGNIRNLFEVNSIDGNLVTLKAPNSNVINLPLFPDGKTTSPWAFLRRWDFGQCEKSQMPTQASGGAPVDNDGALTVVAPSADDSLKQQWLDLEDGIQIRFDPSNKDYRSGEFWLIPARTASRNIVWPPTSFAPNGVPARSTLRFYAPLAIIDTTVNPAIAIDCRRQVALSQLIVSPS